MKCKICGEKLKIDEDDVCDICQMPEYRRIENTDRRRQRAYEEMERRGTAWQACMP
jgi:hypothetical protein